MIIIGGCRSGEALQALGTKTIKFLGPVVGTARSVAAYKPP